MRLSAYFLVAALIFCGHAFAESDPNYDHEYAKNTGRKLERGVSNMTMGLMEIPREMTREGKNHSVMHAIFVGPFVGAAKAVGRTAAGVYETVTFPFPTHPAPEPLVQPEFVLDKDGAKS